MANGTADRACDRCRERRVKCDKRQPTCLRCEKLKKPCPGYDKKRKFVDEGISLRRKFHASDGGSENNEETLRGHDGSPQSVPGMLTNTSLIQGRFGGPGSNSITSETALEPNYREDVASHLSNAGVAATLDPTTSNQLPNADAMLSDIFNDSTFDPSWFDIDPTEFYSNNDNSCGFIPNIPNIVDEVDRNEFLQRSNHDMVSPMNALNSIEDMKDTWAAESQLTTSALITDEREHEMAYLIRHFSEAIGPWMDLFDRDKHFAQLAPLKALRDALLRNAIAAVAAKQLGRTRGSKPYLNTQNQKPATMEIIQQDAAVDWFYKAANYYDKAIAFSRIYLQALSGVLSSPATPVTQMTLSAANSDDLLVAVSIFSLYESLDNGDVGWLQHLGGLKSLFIAVTRTEDKQQQLMPPITMGRKASFWNFARADYQAAYINHQHTYLATEDLELWRNSGLQLQDDGTLYHDSEKIKTDLLGGHDIADLVSHTLLWIVLRVMNYLFSERDSTPTAQRHAQWQHLNSLLDQWHSSLPETFQPCAQVKHPLQPRPQTKEAAGSLIEVFFSINVCAAAMQLYHFACILLLLNQPLQDSPDGGPSPMDTTSIPGASGTSRLRAFREMSAEATRHAHQIVGIALGRPHPAVRVEMLLPLSVAGSCLEADGEREVVLELLRAIEKDTGCSTELRVKELLREWQWDPALAKANAVFG